MPGLSDFSKNKWIDHLLENTAYTPAATIYLALCTDTPASSETGSTISEVDYTSYARTAITFGAANLTSRNITQNAQVNFPKATGGSSTAVGYAICDAATAGNMLASGTLDTSKNIVVNNTPSVASAECVISVGATGGFANYAVQKLHDLMFRNQAFSQPTLYALLTTVTIGNTDTGSTITEASGTNYAREASPNWSAAAAGASATDALIDFGTAGSGGWGTVVAMGWADAATAGNLLIYDNDNVTDQAVAADDTVTVPSGDATVALT